MALGTGRLDRRVVARCALLILALTLPPVVLVQALAGGELDGQESNAWLVVPLALLAGFATGGARAGRRGRGSPLTHAAAAAAAAFAVIALLSASRRAAGGVLSLAYVVRLLLLAQICISTAVLGGWLAGRRPVRAPTTGSGNGPDG